VKIDFDFHVHTIYSGHPGVDTLIPAVMARARELGLRSALILEHVPATMTDAVRTPAEWFSGRGERSAAEAILAELLPRREQFPEVRFAVGLEIDADPERMDGSLMLSDFTGLDAVLAATHMLPGGEAFWFNPPETPEEEKPELLERWLAWIENVAANPRVDVLVHPCAELHHCGLSGGFGPEVRAQFEPVLAAMAEHECAFELNEAMLRRMKPQDLEGYAELVALARERGVRFSAGSDAHRGEHLGAFKRVPQLVARTGIEPEEFWHPEAGASRE